MDLKKLIEDATGLPTASVVFVRPQKLPFIILLDRQTVQGDDFNMCTVIRHNITIEVYEEKVDETNEIKLKNLFDKMGWKWTGSREYVPQPEDCYITTYDIESFYEARKKKG